MHDIQLRGPAAASGKNGKQDPVAPSAQKVQLKATLQKLDYASAEQALSPVQAKGAADANVHTHAAEGTKGSGSKLPYHDAIQKSFGGHDIGQIQAFSGGGAQEACKGMGAEAFATGDKVAFGKNPDLHTAAHEAAHIVQQRAGVSLDGGVGKEGDNYERQADKVADAVVAGKSAEGLLGKESRGSGSSVQKKTVQQKRTIDPDKGITGGKTTFEDFAGIVSDEAKANAQTGNAAENGKGLSVLADQLRSAIGAPAGTFDGRSEKEMLAAIAANTAPRYLARVGAAKYMKPGGVFGGGRDGSKPFCFATEPGDLMGCKPIEALLKVGWKLEQMQGNVGEMIGICIFDTQAEVDKVDGSGKGKVAVDKMEWPELITMAKGDAKFKTAIIGKGADYSRIDEGFEVCKATPVEGAPKTNDATLKALCIAIRETMYDLYGASSLYSGMGATVQESGDLGAREVMVKNNGTNFKLTADNHQLVEIGKLEQADVDAAKAALGI